MLWMLDKMLFLFLKLSGNASFPPPLSKEKEAEYFRKCKAGDKEARNILIERNLRLVAHIAKKYYYSGCDNDDLISIGTIGLIKAIDSYNPDSGTRFATYAGKCLQNEILMYFRSQKKLSCEVSLDETIDVDKDGNPLTYIDVICSEEDIAEEVDKKMMTGRMLHFMDVTLTQRERCILMMRYGLYGTKMKTQREIAAALHISRSYVSRLEKSAIEKLRVAMNLPQ